MRYPEKNTIADDHVPFYRKGLRNIMHIISNPFPSVWHTMADERSALDRRSVNEITHILYIFVKRILENKVSIVYNNLKRAIYPKIDFG